MESEKGIGNSPEEDLEIQKDRAELLSIFPEEIWALLLETLSKESVDLYHLWYCSPFFRTRIEDNSAVFLFPKVWPLVRPHFEASVFADSNGGSSCFKVLMSLGRHDRLAKTKSIRTELLKMRFVCKGWCNDLDNYYYKDNQKNKYHWTNPKTGYLTTQPWQADMLYVDIMSKFSEHFEATHGNSASRSPFLGHAVDFQGEQNPHQFNLADAIPLFWTIFTKYGHHIWHAGLFLDEWIPGNRATYNHLQQFIVLLPNLKSFQLSNTVPLDDELNALMILDDAEQLPSMPKLDNLTCLSLIRPPTHVFQEMIKAYAENLHKLELNLSMGDHSSLVGLYSEADLQILYDTPMPKLEELTWKVISNDQLLLLANSSVQWPLLKDLHLDFDYELECTPYQFFKFLQDHWADKIKSLRMRIPTLWEIQDNDIELEGEGGSSLQLNLPKLKRLRIKTKYCVNLDFLLGVKESLEHLYVEHMPEQLDGPYGFDWKWGNFDPEFIRRQLIQYWGYEDKLRESNIWSLFPKLAKVSKTRGMGHSGARRPKNI